MRNIEKYLRIRDRLDKATKELEDCAKLNSEIHVHVVDRKKPNGKERFEVSIFDSVNFLALFYFNKFSLEVEHSYSHVNLIRTQELKELVEKWMGKGKTSFPNIPVTGLPSE